MSARFNIEDIVLMVVGGLIAVLLFANLVPLLVGPIFNSTTGAVSLYNAFEDIWNYALTPLLGSTTAGALAPFIAVASIIAFAVSLTFGVADFVKRKMGWD